MPRRYAALEIGLSCVSTPNARRWRRYPPSGGTRGKPFRVYSPDGGTAPWVIGRGIPELCRHTPERSHRREVRTSQRATIGRIDALTSAEGGS